jgi:hypothetical protein
MTVLVSSNWNTATQVSYKCTISDVSFWFTKHYRNQRQRSHYNTPWRPRWEVQVYSYTLSLTSALDESDWPTPRFGWFMPKKGTRHLMYSRLSGFQGRSSRVQNTCISPQTWCDTRTFQPVAGRYIHYVKPAHTDITYSTLIHRRNFLHYELTVQS